MPIIPAVPSSSRWKRRFQALVAIAVVLPATIVLWLVGRFGADSPVDYTGPVEHFKYGSTGGEHEMGFPYWIWRALPEVCGHYLPGPGYAHDGFAAVAGEIDLMRLLAIRRPTLSGRFAGKDGGKQDRNWVAFARLEAVSIMLADEGRRRIAAPEFLDRQGVEQELAVRRDAEQVRAANRLDEAPQCFVAVRAGGDDLGDHRIVE